MCFDRGVGEENTLWYRSWNLLKGGKPPFVITWNDFGNVTLNETRRRKTDLHGSVCMGWCRSQHDVLQVHGAMLCLQLTTPSGALENLFRVGGKCFYPLLKNGIKVKALVRLLKAKRTHYQHFCMKSNLKWRPKEVPPNVNLDFHKNKWRTLKTGNTYLNVKEFLILIIPDKC